MDTRNKSPWPGVKIRVNSVNVEPAVVGVEENKEATKFFYTSRDLYDSCALVLILADRLGSTVKFATAELCTYEPSVALPTSPLVKLTSIM